MKPTSILTETERAERDQLEAVISNGIQSFVEVGTALLTISEKRLYRETHGSFEPYCREKWSMSARRAYQLCEAAKVVNELPATVNHGSQLANERQARELAKVEPSRRAEVLEKAGDKPTAKAIRKAAMASAAVASEPTEPPRGESYQPEPELKGIDLAKLDTLPPDEQRVTYWYLMLENLLQEAFSKAADKQLVSMSVCAAMLPKLIKAELQRRKDAAK